MNVNVRVKDIKQVLLFGSALTSSKYNDIDIAMVVDKIVVKFKIGCLNFSVFPRHYVYRVDRLHFILFTSREKDEISEFILSSGKILYYKDEISEFILSSGKILYYKEPVYV